MNKEQNPKLQAFLDTATSGLIVDRELQLDVRAEIESHLEAAIADAKQETDPLQKEQDALKEFGPPEEIADQLVDANRRKMKRRAQARLLSYALLIPLAVIIALLAAWPAFSQLFNASKAEQLFGSPAPGFLMVADSSLRHFFRMNRISPQDRLILEGDTSRANLAEQQKAIWEAHPKDPVFFANYITSYQTTAAEKPLEEQLATLEPARDIDPDNATYDYLRSAWLLKGAATIESEEIGRDENNKPINTYHLDIQDRDRLNASMAAFQEGLKKPLLKRYHREMLLKRLSILGPPKSRLEQIEQIAISAAVLLPELAQYREISRAAVLYGGVLLKEQAEGNLPDASPDPNALLVSWRPFTRQFLDDSFTLIDVLVGAAITNFGSEEAAKIYESVQRQEDADAVRTSGQNISQPVTEWRKSVRGPQNEEWERTIREKAGFLDSMLLPAIGKPQDDFLADYLRPGRELDYILSEQIAFTVMLEVLTLMMIGSFIMALRWRFSKGGVSIPILLQPNARQISIILGTTVFIPMLLFFFLRHFTPLGGMEYSIVIAWPRAVLQLCVLIGFVVVGLMVQMRQYVRTRFQILGLITPPPIPTWLKGIGILTLAYLAVTSLLPGSILYGYAGTGLAGFGAFLTGTWIVAGTLTSIAIMLAAPKKYGLFLGSLGRTCIPVLACAVLLLGLLARPYLGAKERQILASDPSIKELSEHGGFTALENNIVQHLRADMEKRFPS